MDLARFTRPASVAQIGGFRPSEDPLASWAGRVRVALPGETWPTSADEPMLVVAQLNLREAPYLPPVLSDVALMTLFVGPRELPINQPNGTNWELRAYGSLDALVKLQQPAPARAADSKAAKGAPTTYAALPIRWKQIDDHPARDDIPVELLDELDDADGAPSPHSGARRRHGRPRQGTVNRGVPHGMTASPTAVDSPTKSDLKST